MVVKSYAPPPPPDLTLFTPPHVRPGDTVEVDGNPEWRNPVPAFVISTTEHEITAALITEAGLVTWYNCVHRQDPRCQRQMDRFQDEESGVWDISDQTRRLQKLETDLAEIQQQLAILVTRPPEPTSAPRQHTISRLEPATL